MKKILIIQVILAAALLGSCNFLNVDDYFDDTFKEDEIFESKYNIERYFNGAVREVPREGRIYYWGSMPGATGSDEAISMGTYFNGFVDQGFSGTTLTTDQISYTNTGGWEWNFNVWPECYKVIRKVNTILPRINEVPDMTAFEKIELRAQARFLRAYAYYWILQNQGPMILVGDDVLETNEGPEYYQTVRNTYDECVDYICSEFEAAAEGLPTTQPVDMFGAPTKGAALALVARIRLTAASPLYNGGAPAKKYYGNFTRKTDGVHYISQEYDERKWAVAAAAAKRVMDLGIYELHYVLADSDTAPLPAGVPSGSFLDGEGAGGIDHFRSYSEMFTGETANTMNKEIIWGSTSIDKGNSENLSSQMGVVFPISFGGNSVIAIPQRIIDSYYMIDGRDIKNASSAYPYENRPYDETCITQDDWQLSKNYTLPAGTYLAYANREPRFYASIAFSGTRWLMESTTDNSLKNAVIKYHYGSPQGRGTNARYNLTGYTCFKYVHPRDAKTGDGAREIEKTFPLIRYAEILLIYAEALNNLTQTHTIDGENFSRDPLEISKAFNLVRYRAGLPGLTSMLSIEEFNEVLQRERLIEFLHENRRYYDICRWGIWEDLEKEPLTGMNINMGEWAGFYNPTIINYSTIRERVFKPKFMMLPLHRDELRRVPTMDQNPGWED